VGEVADKTSGIWALVKREFGALKLPENKKITSKK
jgi:hypothetical protein